MTIYRLQGFEEKQKGIYYEYDADSTPLGEGAMGKVYLGYEYETNQKVAIKKLFDKYANSKAVFIPR